MENDVYICVCVCVCARVCICIPSLFLLLLLCSLTISNCLASSSSFITFFLCGDRNEIMNRTVQQMTKSVRYGVIGPDDASRTIHECAVLLGLKLAADIPVTTVLLSNMPNHVTVEEIRKTFTVYGNISTIAIAPPSNNITPDATTGFGILRYTSDDAVIQVMNKFQSDKVIVQNVPVQLKVIESWFLQNGRQYY